MLKDRRERAKEEVPRKESGQNHRMRRTLCVLQIVQGSEGLQ